MPKNKTNLNIAVESLDNPELYNVIKTAKDCGITFQEMVAMLSMLQRKQGSQYIDVVAASESLRKVMKGVAHENIKGGSNNEI